VCDTAPTPALTHHCEALSVDITQAKQVCRSCTACFSHDICAVSFHLTVGGGHRRQRHALRSLWSRTADGCI
jgi:hypothetical protein